MTERFTLTDDQVPSPPVSPLWVDILKWCVCVMDPADERLGFIASCLAYAIKNNGLTERQAAACSAIKKRLIDDWAHGILLCQNTPPDEPYGLVESKPPEVKH